MRPAAVNYKRARKPTIEKSVKFVINTADLDTAYQNGK